jgi:hypothetical protein
MDSWLRRRRDFNNRTSAAEHPAFRLEPIGLLTPES